VEITPDDFRTLHLACDVLDAAGVRYVIGGGTAVVIYGRNRRTKDFDIFLNREELERAMTALTRVGFTASDTEKKWLFKAWHQETLVDIIVESRGGVRVGSETMRRSRLLHLYGYDFRIMGLEDTLYRKILTLTEGRPDWYDAISIITRQQGQLDWDYLLECAQRFPRRVLSFLLFAQTELHIPPGYHRASVDELMTGDAPGLIPDRVIYTLLLRVLNRRAFEPPLPGMEALPEAA